MVDIFVPEFGALVVGLFAIILGSVLLEKFEGSNAIWIPIASIVIGVLATVIFGPLFYQTL